MTVRLFGLAGALAVAAAAPVAAEEFSGDALVIEDFIGSLEVRTSDDTDVIRVNIDAGADVVEAPTVSERGDRVRISGEGEKVRNCEGGGADLRLRVRRSGGLRDISDFPTITVDAPADVKLVIRDTTVFGEVGDIGSADVALSSCGELILGDIAGGATLMVAGSGGLSAGNIGDGATLVVAGSGDLAVGDVTGDLSMNISGSGDAAVQSVSGGSMHANVQGSGDIFISNGMVENLNTSIMGSGDVSFGGSAGDARLTVMGSGDVTIAEVSGDVSRTVMGSGDIVVGN